MNKNFPSRPNLSSPTLITLFTLFTGLFFASTSSAQLLETSYLSPTPASKVNSVAWSPDGLDSETLLRPT